MSKRSFVVCFAGVPGCGKSGVAHTLGVTFALPCLERDKIREDVKADFGVTDINIPEALDEFNRRAAHRLDGLVKTKTSFVMDSSVDRSWVDFKKKISDAGYEWLLISFDMSRKWVEKMYELHGNSHLPFIDQYFQQHEDFIGEHGIDVDVVITDGTFSRRNDIALQAMRDFLNQI